MENMRASPQGRASCLLLAALPRVLVRDALGKSSLGRAIKGRRDQKRVGCLQGAGTQVDAALWCVVHLNDSGPGPATEPGAVRGPLRAEGSGFGRALLRV